MKFEGSATIQIECSECQSKSPPFRVYLWEEDYEHGWDGALPKSWTVDEEAELYGKEVAGGCPQHSIQ